MNPITRLLRYFQGERPGMGSQLIVPSQRMIQLAAIVSPAIIIENDVRLADVSFYQGAIDFQKMASGLQGVIVRAGQRTWVDSQFVTNWTKAKTAGLPRGSYWFYDSREDPKKQAALWWSLVKNDPGELVHAADLEENYGGPYGSAVAMKAFIQEFQRLSGLPSDRIPIYTGYYWWLSRVGPDPFFLDYPLWLAWYADPSVVRIPTPWSQTDLLFWQYTSSGNGPAYGVSSQEIDLDWYSGTIDEYSQRFQLGTTPPNNGETMTLYEGTGKLSSTPYTRIRKPNTDGSLNPDGMTIGQINPGQAFKADAKSQDSMARDWLHITEVGGKPINGWSAAWLLDYQEVNPPPPPTPTVVYPASVTLNYADGTRKNYIPE